MKNFLKKVSFYGVIVLLYFSITSVYNYSFDPYGILENRKTFIAIRPNEHSLKVHYVLQNPEKFNSFLFSNSKGGTLHFNQLNNAQENWYNMTYSLGTPEEFYMDLLLFLDKDIAIKNVVVGLDEGVIYERASSHVNQASRKFVSMEKQTVNWEYLFLPISIKKLLRRDFDKKHIVHDIYDNGNYYAKNAYHNDCETLEKLVKIPYEALPIKKPIDVFSQVKTLKKIKSLCRERDINLTFLIHPCSEDNYIKSTEKRLQFTRLLAILENENFALFHPFQNSLIKNNSCYWLDRHHYSEKVGDNIVQMYYDLKNAN